MIQHHVPGTFDRTPLHCALVFPEIFEKGAFDAVIGNPPFLGGQKLTGSLGTAYREYLVSAVGRGARGSADLVAYFGHWDQVCSKLRTSSTLAGASRKR